MSWATLIAAVVVGAASCVYWWFYHPCTGTRLSFLHPPGKRSLDPEAARKKLFDAILDEFASSRCFSFPSDISPNLFVVYAHNNEKEGAAYDGCVRQLISWLERIYAQTLSDQSPLPPFIPRVEGTRAIGNVLANQMCLLPPSPGETPIRSSVDKIIVCGSEVLETYCGKPSARAYIEDIVRICISHVGTPTEANLEPIIRDRINNERKNNDFHHVLTELAFVEVRVRGNPETQDVVPVALNRIKPGDTPMGYLPCFELTDVKLKLGSSSPSDLHALFFKLLTQLYPEYRDFIGPFEAFYDLAKTLPELHGNGSGRIGEKDFSEIVNLGIEQAHGEYHKACGVFAGNSILRNYTAKLSDKTSRILEHVSAATHSEILDWLSTVPTSEIHGKYHDSGTKRIEGTCDWVIEDARFRQWHECKESALLWLNGDTEVGTGKSYCMSRVIDFVRSDLQASDNDEGFAFFYCNKQDSDRSQPNSILRNIIRQLAIGPFKTGSSPTAIERTVHDLWKRHKTEGIFSTFAEWEACLVALTETYPRTTIVLDALDECGYDDSSQGQEIIKFLINLVNRCPGARPVKIFVSGRPQDDLRRHLDRYPTIRMQEKHNANDIASFLRIKISEQHPWSEYSQQSRDEMVREILAMSRDMFLLAALQIQQLRKYTLQSVLKSHLKRLPDSLNSIYGEIYRDATSDPEERRFLDKALRWVLCAARPLTTRELLFAMSQEFESDSIKPQHADLNESLIRRWTHNLLSLEDTSGDGYSPRPGVWRLAHQAVAEFLQESRDFRLSLAHCEAGKVCLLLLIENFGSEPPYPRVRSDSREASGKDDNFECSSVLTKTALLRHIPFPDALVEYAVYGWPTHICAQDNREGPGVEILSLTLQRFLGQPQEGSPAYRRWIDHAFHYSFRVPAWSMFYFRLIHSAGFCERVMTPMLFASYLGIYTCLSDWWSSANINYNEVYHPGIYLWPTPSVYRAIRGSSHSWSLVSLACAHKELALVKHLLEKNAQVNATTAEDVPPLVAAVVGGWVELVDLLIKRGADICSPFTTRNGHILMFAVRSDSIHVLELLIHQPGLSRAQEIEGILSSLDFEELRSAQAIEVLIGKGVNVNTPLKVGTLLLAAASNGWDEMADCLIRKGAALNAGAYFGKYDNVLHALISSHHNASPEMITLFARQGAQVNGRVLIQAWRWAKPVGIFFDIDDSQLERRKELLLALLEYVSDINNTWNISDKSGYETSALIEAVIMGEPDVVRLLSKHGASVNLQVKNQNYTNALESVFHQILSKLEMGSSGRFYAERKMINLLVEEGASLDNLEGDCLHKALAAAAFAGWEEPMQYFLHRGACPYKSFSRERSGLDTALGAAVWSDHPEVSLIFRMLLNTYTSVMDQYGYYVAAHAVFDRLFPDVLSLVVDSPHQPWPRMRDSSPWLTIADVLARNHAVWDTDLTQWIEFLKSRRPHIWEQHARSLSNLKEKLAHNRARFFDKFPCAKSPNQWTVKGAESFTKRRRMLEYRSIIDALRLHFGTRQQPCASSGITWRVNETEPVTTVHDDQDRGCYG